MNLLSTNFRIIMHENFSCFNFSLTSDQYFNSFSSKLYWSNLVFWPWFGITWKIRSRGFMIVRWWMYEDVIAWGENESAVVELKKSHFSKIFSDCLISDFSKNAQNMTKGRVNSSFQNDDPPSYPTIENQPVRNYAQLLAVNKIGLSDANRTRTL